MFSNSNLYTLDPKVFNEGSISKEKLIKNVIDLEYLSHIIFIPGFEFESYSSLDPSKLRPKIADEFSKKQVEVILGFYEHHQFKESDIAINTDFLTLLQLIHVCQHVKLIEE